jgi:hypothetical protein
MSTRCSLRYSDNGVEQLSDSLKYQTSRSLSMIFNLINEPTNYNVVQVCTQGKFIQGINVRYFLKGCVRQDEAFPRN